MREKAEMRKGKKGQRKKSSGGENFEPQEGSEGETEMKNQSKSWLKKDEG